MSLANTVKTIVTGIKNGGVVPYLGPGVLKNITSPNGNEHIPWDSDSLILALNNGQPMAPRLMYEFPRAAMNLELKKGRSYVERFLSEVYGEKSWQRSQLHDWVGELKPHYVIDINRDTQLQTSYQGKPHNLVIGLARVAGQDYRFKLYEYDGKDYTETSQFDAKENLPTLFKPMGTPIPEANFIASDADYVDYITELMGGFAIPQYLKNYRQQKQYLFLGMSLQRDTERMVLSELIYGANSCAGWAFIAKPTDKERRFCDNKKIELIEADWDVFLGNSAAIETSDKPQKESA